MGTQSTPLHFACELNPPSEKCVKELVSLDVSPNCKNGKGFTPLLLVCYVDSYVVAEMLLAAGAEV